MTGSLTFFVYEVKRWQGDEKIFNTEQIKKKNKIIWRDFDIRLVFCLWALLFAFIFRFKVFALSKFLGLHWSGTIRRAVLLWQSFNALIYFSSFVQLPGKSFYFISDLQEIQIFFSSTKVIAVYIFLGSSCWGVLLLVSWIYNGRKTLLIGLVEYKMANSISICGCTQEKNIECQEISI